MELMMMFYRLAVVLLVVGTGARAQVTFKQQPWNMKGDVLVVATGSLRMHGNHPMNPDVVDPEDCQGVCYDIAGCNGWSFCNIKGGCGTGCKDYLQAHPILPMSDPSRFGVPLTTPLSDFQRPGPFEGLCKYDDTQKWNYGTCTLKIVANPQNPEYWTQDSAEGWVSGTIVTPADCGRDIAARSCAKCKKLPAAKVSQCLACAKAAAKVGPINPIIRTLLDAAPITTDGCAACLTLASPATCLNCIAGNKKCAECAYQNARERSVLARNGQPAPVPLPYDVNVCVNCAVANGDLAKEPCINCGSLKTAAKKTKCTSCVASFKTRFCNYVPGKVTNPDCIPQQACGVCADSASIMKNCTDCLSRRPYNPDCQSCAYAKSTVQKTCYDCAKKVKVYSSDGTGACSTCVSLTPGAMTTDCINNCALRADLPVRVGRYWCGWCTENRNQTSWNSCYSCLAKNPDDTSKCSIN